MQKNSSGRKLSFVGSRFSRLDLDTRMTNLCFALQLDENIKGCLKRLEGAGGG